MKGRFLGVIAGLFLAHSAAALPSGGGDLTDQLPPDLNQDFDRFGTFADRGNMTLTMGSNFGTLTVDAITRTAYLSTSSGIREFNVNTALSSAGLNPNNYDFQSAFPGINRSVISIDPDGDWSQGNPIFGPCDLSPCFESWDPVDMSRILVPVIDYNTPPVVDAALTADMRGFSNWRQERCDDFNESVIASTVGAPAVGVSCAVGEDLISLLICAGGLINEAHQSSQRASAASDCNSSYPGPGRWSGSTLPQGYGQ